MIRLPKDVRTERHGTQHGIGSPAWQAAVTQATAMAWGPSQTQMASSVAVAWTILRGESRSDATFQHGTSLLG